MPTGWRPTDVQDKYPIQTADPRHFQKYDTEASVRLKAWSWTQFGMLLFMLFHLLYSIVEIGNPGIFLYGIFMFLMVYSYTSLMDRDTNAIWMEAAKSVIGLTIIFYTSSWFGLDSILPGGTYFITGYLILSALVVGHFVINEIGWNTQSKASLEDAQV